MTVTNHDINQKFENELRKKDLVIEQLTMENTDLKKQLLEAKKELPTDSSTRKKQIEEFIHNEKNKKDFLASGF